MTKLEKSFEQSLQDSAIVAVVVALLVCQTVLLHLFAVRGVLLENSEEGGLVAYLESSGPLECHHPCDVVVVASYLEEETCLEEAFPCRADFPLAYLVVEPFLVVGPFQEVDACYWWGPAAERQRAT